MTPEEQQHIVTISPQDAFVLVGELYIETRILREQLSLAKAEIAELKKTKEGVVP